MSKTNTGKTIPNNTCNQKQPTPKTVNFRSFLIIALFLLAAVFAALLSINILWLGTIAFALLIGGAIFLCFFYRKKEKFKFVTFIICAIAITTAYFSFIFTESNWSHDQTGVMRISGTVETDREIDGQRRIYLKNAVVGDRAVKGRVALYIDTLDNPLDSGMFIVLEARVSTVKLVDGFKVNAAAFRNNLKYNAHAKQIDTGMVDGYKKLDFFIRAREFIHKKLTDAMGAEYGALAYGMVTGDKDFIDGEVKNYFSAAGLSHILAVSGLHLGLVAAVLTWILKKCRASRKINAVVTSVFMVLYVFLAGFSPSILRAAIMSLIGVYVYLFGSRRDSLSSLCIAFCIILTAAPFFLFEAGFALSVSCVYGITLFYSPINRGIKKIKTPKPVASALALGVSVQIGMLPCAVFFFNALNTYSLIINVLLMPLIGLTFSAIVICLLIAVILPFKFFAVPLTVSGLGLSLIDTVAKFFAAFPLSRIILYLTPAAFICYALYFCISRFTMLKRKRLAALLCVPLCLILFFIPSYPKADSASVVPFDYAYSNLSLITTERGNYLAGDLFSGAGAQKRLRELKIRKLDAVFVNELTPRTANELMRLNAFFADFTVYFPLSKSGGAEVWDGLLESGLTFTGFYEEGGLVDGFCAVYDSGSFYGYSYEEENLSVLFVPYGKKYDKFERIDEYGIIRAVNFRRTEHKQILLLNRFIPDEFKEGEEEDGDEEENENENENEEFNEEEILEPNEPNQENELEDTEEDDLDDDEEEEKPPIDYSLIFSFDMYNSYAFNYKKGTAYKVPK